jgi:hypothetical protein
MRRAILPIVIVIASLVGCGGDDKPAPKVSPGGADSPKAAAPNTPEPQGGAGSKTGRGRGAKTKSTLEP